MEVLLIITPRSLFSGWGARAATESSESLIAVFLAVACEVSDIEDTTSICLPDVSIL